MLSFPVEQQRSGNLFDDVIFWALVEIVHLKAALTPAAEEGGCCVAEGMFSKEVKNF